MTKAQKKELARTLYISGSSLDAVAKALGVSRRTVQAYKAEEGDWDKKRAEVLMERGGERIYENFVEYMHQLLEAVNEDTSITPEKKVEKIAQLGDAFTKMKRVAQHEDPERFKHGILRHALKTLLERAKEKLTPECMEALVALIEETQEELADVAL